MATPGEELHKLNIDKEELFAEVGEEEWELLAN